MDGRSKRWRVTVARLQIVAAAFLFSTGGAAIKATSFDGFSGGMAVACLRSAVAALAMALMLPAARRSWSWRTWVVGVAFAVTLILFVTANKLTTSANTIFLQSAAPLWIAIAAPFVLRERVPPREVWLMGILALGLALVLADAPAATGTASDPTLGNILAAASGVGWAASIMGLRWLSSTHGASAAAGATVAGNLIAAIACAPFAADAIGASTGEDWLLVVYLGVVQIALAYVCLTAGVRHVPALTASLLLLVEPAVNPVWTWIVHGERVGLLAIAGGAVILGATAVKTWLDSRDGAPRPARPVPGRPEP